MLHRLVLLAAASLSASVCAAEDVRTLVEEALRNNPEIAAAQKSYEAARQRPRQASSLPDPMFSPGYASNGRPWPGAGLGTEPTSNVGFMVAQEIPFPGKRRLLGNMAEREADAELQEYRRVTLNVVARLKQAYYRRAYAFTAANVLDRNLALLRHLLGITEVRYSVGRTAQQDVLKAQTQISVLETRKIRLEREQAAREAEIASLLNRRPGSVLARPADLAPSPLPLSLEELYAAARENSPVLGRDEKIIQRAELGVSMARKEYYPDYTVRAGYFNMGGMPDMYQVAVDFKVPLYFFRKQRPGVTEKSQELIQSRKMLEADRQSLDFQISDDFLIAQTSERLTELYSKAVIPQANLTLESSLVSYETGAVDFTTVLMNYIAVVEYEMNYYEELQNFHLALSRLEEMTGRSLIQ